MRTALLAAGLLALASPALAADPVEGEWVPPDGGSKIRIAPCADNAALICGNISWLPPATAKNLDTNNPKAALRSRTVLGIQTFWGFKAAGPGKPRSAGACPAGIREEGGAKPHQVKPAPDGGNGPSFG